MKILHKISKIFLEDFIQRSSEHFWPFTRIFFKTKIKTKVRKSSVDIKKIFNDIYQISEKIWIEDFMEKKLYEELLKKIIVPEDPAFTGGAHFFLGKFWLDKAAINSNPTTHLTEKK